MLLLVLLIIWVNVLQAVEVRAVEERNPLAIIQIGLGILRLLPPGLGSPSAPPAGAVLSDTRPYPGQYTWTESGFVRWRTDYGRTFCAGDSTFEVRWRCSKEGFIGHVVVLWVKASGTAVAQAKQEALPAVVVGVNNATGRVSLELEVVVSGAVQPASFFLNPCYGISEKWSDVVRISSSNCSEFEFRKSERTSVLASSMGHTAPSTACFHESTVVVVEDQPVTMKSPLPLYCRIPHIVRADGVRISTSCGRILQLTTDHLVFTQRGLVEAGQLVPDADVLFVDMSATIPTCKVASVKAEQQQSYFGLNCRTSVVLANGIRTSVFGRYHAIPALWMRWVGLLVGYERASRWGDTMASWLL